jgi:type II secretory pathway pseudopilin PulG
MPDHHLQRNAHSLVEIMVVLVIFSIVMAMVFMVDYAGRASWKQQEAQQEAQQEMRKAVDKMVSEIRQTRSTFLSTLAPSVPPDGNAYAAIAFKIPQDTDNDGDVIDAGNNVEWSNTITYSIGGTNNDQLLRRVLDGAGNVLSTEVVANDITQLTFTRLAATPNNVRITCIFQTQQPGGQLGTANCTMDVYIRN